MGLIFPNIGSYLGRGPPPLSSEAIRVGTAREGLGATGWRAIGGSPGRRIPRRPAMNRFGRIARRRRCPGRLPRALRQTWLRQQQSAVPAVVVLELARQKAWKDGRAFDLAGLVELLVDELPGNLRCGPLLPNASTADSAASSAASLIAQRICW